MQRIRLTIIASLFVCSLGVGQRPGFERFGEPMSITVAFPSLVGDFNGDGNMDVYGETGLLTGDGNGHFTATGGAVISGAVQSLRPVTGDLDGDGDLDILTGGGTPALWLNDGVGGFSISPTPLPPIPGTTTSVEHLSLGDVDADGDLDVFLGLYAFSVVGGSAGFPRLWLNSGAGVFVDASSNLPAFSNVTAVMSFVHDFDADGDNDLLFAGSPRAFILVNAGNGSFAIGPSLTGNNSVFAATRGDFDGNGIPDVALRMSNGDDRIVFNVGTALAATSDTPGLEQPVGYAAVDVDGDGLDELVRRTVTGLSVHLVSAVSGIAAAPPSFVWESFVDVPLRADVDGDGDHDLVSQTEAAMRVFFNDGRGGLVEAYDGRPSDSSMSQSVIGDVDGDGAADFVTTIPSATGIGGLALVRNDAGRMKLDPASVGSPAPLGSTQVSRLIDADGDGDLDLYSASSALANGIDRIYRNDGTTFAPIMTLTGTGGAIDAEIDDLDGDGDDDLLIARRLDFAAGPAGVASVVARNIGGGAFQLAPLGTGHTTWDVAVGDVDGDGDSDVLQGNRHWDASFVDPCVLYLNDGAGNFPTTVTLPLEARSVALADLDGDGDLDAVLENAIFANDGSGAFLLASALGGIAGGNVGRMSIGDVDEDGDPDIIDQQGLLFENLGGLNFAPPTLVVPGPGFVPWTTAPALPLTDLDFDGDLDVIVQGIPYWNTTRHLAHRELPRTGRTVDVEINGTAGRAWWLIASLGTANVPIAPFGRLLIDPATARLVTVGILDPNGVGIVPVAIPSLPGLDGFNVYWQAFLHEPAGGRLTGRLTTTIRDV